MERRMQNEASVPARGRLTQDYDAYERHAKESGTLCRACVSNRVPAFPVLSCARCDGTGFEPIMTREEWDYARAESRREI